MVSCFGIVRPHQHDIAVEQIGLKVLPVCICSLPRRVQGKVLARPWVGVRVCHLLFIVCYIHLLIHRSTMWADSTDLPSRRMPWENWCGLNGAPRPQVLLLDNFTEFVPARLGRAQKRGRLCRHLYLINLSSCLCLFLADCCSSA